MPIYRIFPDILDWSDSANNWFTPHYFSIVTYTTLGFGDVRPATLAGEIIVSSEVIRAKHRSAQLTCELLQEKPTASAAFSE